MCRSIKTLRPPVLPEEATEDEIRAAALQYVRKVSGFRAPAAHNREVFDRAVDVIAQATAELLDGLEVRGQAARQGYRPRLATIGRGLRLMATGSARSPGSRSSVPTNRVSTTLPSGSRKSTCTA